MSVLLRTAAVAVLIASLAGTASAQDRLSFHLKNGDTVVFYGDSITEQNRYTQFVELYAVTRFPAMQLHFRTSGVGGDKVSGGYAGTIDQRLTRDLFAYSPSVITVMLGMNDGQYQAPSESVTAAYSSGYDHILTELAAKAPGARVTLVGPSAFDDVTRPVWFDGGYNQVMQAFARIDAEKAAAHGALFVDFNAPTVAAIRTANSQDPLVARALLPDRVHPEAVMHWVMAEALLKGWGAPSLVSSISVDAAKLKATADNATVDGLTRDGAAVRWTALEKALPLPLDGDNETFAQLFKVSNIQQALNQERLQVTGLKAGRYTLSIDDHAVTAFSAEQLALGVNLADYRTPMRDQAQRASWLVRDRAEAGYVRMRLQVNGLPLGTPDTVLALDRKLEEDIHRTVQPTPHRFQLTPVN